MEENENKINPAELLKTLVVTSRAIKIDYDLLQKMEINGEKNTQKYNQKLNDLKDLLECEDALYDFLRGDLHSLYFISEYLYPNNDMTFKKSLDILNTGTVADIIKLRIYNRVNDLLSEFKYEVVNVENLRFDDDDMREFDEDYENYDEFSYEMDDNDDEREVEVFYEDETASLLEQQLNDFKLELAFQSDILNTLLPISQKYIDNKKYANIKDSLIENKYDIAYINKNVEENLLKNNFNIPKESYLASTILSDIQNREGIIDEFIPFINNLYIDQVQKIRLFLNGEINTNDNQDFIIKLCIIMRTLILFLDQETVDTYKELFIAELLLYNQDKFIIEAIDEIFNENMKDMNIPNVVHLILKLEKK